MIKAVFLDRDGTINVDKTYVHRVEDFEFIPGAIDAMKDLYRAGFELFVVTNQSGIALGYYKEEDVWKVHEYMFNELFRNGVCLSGIKYCPHHSSVSPCNCRKPAPGMLESLISGFDVDVSRSYMIGDKMTDIEAGNKVNLTTVLLNNRVPFIDRSAGYCCRDLSEASKFILWGGKCQP